VPRSFPDPGAEVELGLRLNCSKSPVNAGPEAPASKCDPRLLPAPGTEQLDRLAVPADLMHEIHHIAIALDHRLAQCRVSYPPVAQELRRDVSLRRCRVLAGSPALFCRRPGAHD
jgi:hypothetical protein